MTDDHLKVVYLVLYLIITTVRTRHTFPYRRLSVRDHQRYPLEYILLGLTGFTMILPLVYIFSSALQFADYDLPVWMGWTGAAIFCCAIWLLDRSHRDLGRNWTPTIALRDDHRLVKTGVFKYIRHPMYAAHLLWAVAQIFMLQNWLAGFAFLIVSLPQYLLRVRAEEQMMLTHFGQEYREYMRHSGRLIPRFGKESDRKDHPKI